MPLVGGNSPIGSGGLGLVVTVGPVPVGKKFPVRWGWYKSWLLMWLYLSFLCPQKNAVPTGMFLVHSCYFHLI